MKNKEGTLRNTEKSAAFITVTPRYFRVYGQAGLRACEFGHSPIRFVPSQACAQWRIAKRDSLTVAGAA